MTRIGLALTIGIVGWWALLPAAVGTHAATPSGCDVPHRSVGATLEIVGHGVAESSIAEPIPYVAPEGIPADGAIAANVQATVDHLVGCWNAGDILGFLSVLTDDFLARQASEFEFTEAQLSATTFDPPPADQRVTVREIRDVTIRPSGRIDALVVIMEGEDETSASAAVMTFVANNAGFLIDGWQEVTLTGNDAAWTIVSGEGYRGALVPLDQAAEFVRSLDGRDTQGAWLPDEAQIAVLEAALPGFLARSPRFGKPAHPLADYGRQYAGFVAGGHAYILVNAFCDTVSLDWTHQPVFVMDGGNCFFQVTYEPATGAFSDLRVKGDA